MIIGSGSGNSIVDHRFADLDVAIVEHGVFGGTCLNVGCIPTKMYVYPADVPRGTSGTRTAGIDATLDKVRWRDVRDRIFGRIDPISAAGLHGTARCAARTSPSTTATPGSPGRRVSSTGRRSSPPTAS